MLLIESGLVAVAVLVAVSLPLGEGKERFLEDHLAITLKAPAENIYTLSIWNDMEQVFSVGWLDGDNRRSPSRNDLPNFQGPYHSYSFAGWQLMTKCAFSIQWQDLEISWSVRLGLKLTLKSRLRKSFSVRRISWANHGWSSVPVWTARSGSES